jgi:hypothetical protein
LGFGVSDSEDEKRKQLEIYVQKRAFIISDIDISEIERMVENVVD